MNYIISVLDNFMAWDATWRPLFVGWLTGLCLGDQRTGLIMGAELEAIYMGISAIGGVIPSDPESGTLIPVAAVILSGTDMNAAIALAIPVGTLITYANTLVSPIQLAFLGLYDKYAEADDQKHYTLLHYLYCFLITPLPRTVIIFLALWLGVGNIGAINDAMPLWLINGLDVASGMLVAVGFGILTSMIWSKKLGIFFFVGFVLAEMMGLKTIGVAIIALAIAISIFLIETKLQKIQNSMDSGTVASQQSEQKEDSLF
ncbi:MAG: PTS sugar transporter subunit IIC [Solobacterium sp.]|nr:PTS sugar transporter subunit IIC [Solobacterium sp.]MCH4265332.1 PTS sugar transporter subunit IIC [Solobacterium sp.]